MAGERRLPGLGLYGYWTEGSDGWKDGTDENWLSLSVLVGGRALSRTTALPSSPTDGMVYVVPAGATNAGKIAVRDNGAWRYLTPQAGARLLIADEGKFVFYDGSAWTAEPSGTSGGSGGVPEAPTDGKAYLRSNAGWVEGAALDSGGAKHRYWRALFTAPHPQGGRTDYVSVAEFEWRSTVGGGQKASGGTPLSSGAYSSTTGPEKAYDGTSDTYWESQRGGSMSGGTIWLGYDFGSPVSIAQILIRKSTQYLDENPYAVSIQWSDDNSAWTTIHEFKTGFTVNDSGTAMTSTLPGASTSSPFREHTSTDAVMLALSDIGGTVYVSGATGVVRPPPSGAALGAQIRVIRGSTSAMQFQTASSGDGSYGSFSSPNGIGFRAQWSSALLTHVGSGKWVIDGDMTN